jgi:hypothetical protein
MNRPRDRRRNLDHPHTAKAILREQRRYARRIDRWHRRWEFEQGIHDDPVPSTTDGSDAADRSVADAVFDCRDAFDGAPRAYAPRDPETEACLHELDEEYSLDNDRWYVGRAA